MADAHSADGYRRRGRTDNVAGRSALVGTWRSLFAGVAGRRRVATDRLHPTRRQFVVHRTSSGKVRRALLFLEFINLGRGGTGAGRAGRRAGVEDVKAALVQM